MRPENLRSSQEAGDMPREVGVLYRQHAQMVARWAYRLGPTLDVEDVVQEVFLTVHRLLPRFRGEARITTWMFRITRNVVRYRLRKERLRRVLFGSGDLLGRLPSQRPTPVEDLERRQAEEMVYKALDRLSEKYRTVFILFEIEGLSGEEIAELLGQRLPTVWVWLHRARAHFGSQLVRLHGREKQ